MTVPFLDLEGLHHSMRAELDASVARVIDHSAFVGGEEVAAFEQEFAASHELVGAAGVASGTDALALALRALGIGPGDEVVIPSMTFVATAEAVVHAGADPVIVDVEPRMLLLDPEAVEAARTDRTRAVVPVHLYGNPVDGDHLDRWRQEGMVVVEDAAQAHLAGVGDGRVGHRGHAACFSFYPGKNLGALGDGGAVASTDEGVLERVRRLRDHGRSEKYLHDDVGWCSRLDGLQAAVLRAKLPHLADWTEGRRRAAAAYRERLGELRHLGVELVEWSPGAVHHLLVVRVGQGRRDEVLDGLRSGGVGCGIHYPVPLSRQPSMARWAQPCPVAESAASEILSLPMDPRLHADQIDRVCEVLQRVLGG